MGVFSQSGKSWEKEFRAQVKSQVGAAIPVVVVQVRDKTRNAALAHVPDAIRIMAEHGYTLRQTDNIPLGTGFSRVIAALLTFERSTV